MRNPGGDLRFVALFTLIMMAFSIHTGSAAEDDLSYDLNYLDQMGITMEPGSGRPYIYSGRGSSFFYGSTRTFTEEGWMGFHWDRRKLWDDWMVVVDGDPLDRNLATVTVYPHQVVFNWPEGHELSIRLLGVKRDDLQFVFSTPKVDVECNLFLMFPQGSDIPEAKREKPLRFLPVMVPTGEDTVGVAFGSKTTFSVRQIQPVRNSAHGPDSGQLAGKTIFGIGFPVNRFEATVVYGQDPLYLEQRLTDLYNHLGVEWQNRQHWLLDEINRAVFKCSDERFTLAVNWAKVSLARLFFEDEKGVLLWAGLPWFNNCWGRDTFISLPGACLVLGKYDDAKAILQRFAEWQMRNPNSPDYGKIPNLVSGGEIMYNTADGTPWFVREVFEYGLYSGDTDLWQAYLQPNTGAVWLANEGTIAHRLDPLGFVVHGDADTWMDAKGMDGAWSPRGNRAVEIQALWITQLDVSIKMAEALGESNPVPAATLERWKQQLEQSKTSFQSEFVKQDPPGLYDHLNSDGAPDDKIRPNQLFAISAVSDTLLSDEVAEAVVNEVREHCVYPWGVASLAQNDPDFHPYHQTWHYPKDEAYHNGIVWTWLAGPFITAAGGSWPLTEQMATQILDWGAPGTLSENLAAVPRDGNDHPYCSGTVSQTWSLAEFIRNLYQDYLGVRPSFTEYELIEKEKIPRWILNPHVPIAWNSAQVLVPVKDAFLKASCHRVDQKPVGSVFYKYVNTSGIAIEKLVLPVRAIPIKPIIPIDIGLKNQWMITPTDGNWVMYDMGGDELYPGSTDFPASPANEDMTFLEPHIAPDLKSLAPPDWYLMSQDEVTVQPRASIPVCSVVDETNDDHGGSGYTYPKAAVFKPGILDLTGFVVREDGLRIYFELDFAALVNPGWHKEYGFQLTYATICIHSGTKGEKTRTDVGRNSGWKLDKDFAADRFIYVGGPIDVEDASGKMLAQYVPRDASGRIGDVDRGIIRFGIPRRFLPGDPSQWKITVLVGGQDDHGGAGTGEFRSVDKEASEWIGGGGGPDKHNVYDWLMIDPLQE